MEHQKSPAKSPLHICEYRSNSWSRILLDYCGQAHGEHLVVLHARSKWREVYALYKPTNPSRAMRRPFSQVGNPK